MARAARCAATPQLWLTLLAATLAVRVCVASQTLPSRACGTPQLACLMVSLRTRTLLTSSESTRQRPVLLRVMHWRARQRHALLPLCLRCVSVAITACILLSGAHTAARTSGVVVRRPCRVVCISRLRCRRCCTDSTSPARTLRCARCRSSRCPCGGVRRLRCWMWCARRRLSRVCVDVVAVAVRLAAMDGRATNVSVRPEDTLVSVSRLLSTLRTATGAFSELAVLRSGCRALRSRLCV